MDSPRKWFGQAGHFVDGHRCQFHLHTHVNGYCVSTIGEYYPRSIPEGSGMQEVGDGRFYETMVFRLKGDEIGDHNELDMSAYRNRDEANAGHMRMCNRWARKVAR